MLSVKKCREVLGNKSSHTDEFLERMRGELYALANVILDGVATAKSPSPRKPSDSADGKQNTPGAGGTYPIVGSASPYADVLALLPEDDRHAVEERAAIHQFDGGCTREQGEKLALGEHWNRKLTEGNDEH